MQIDEEQLKKFILESGLVSKTDIDSIAQKVPGQSIHTPTVKMARGATVPVLEAAGRVVEVDFTTPGGVRRRLSPE